MNQIKAILKMNADELALGIAGSTASWHEQYKGNAWVFVGGLVDNLTEGDVLAVCSQYGEIEDFHLVRDEESGKSKGFGFLKYEDERSTVLAVDNLNGFTLLGKTLRVDHTDYRPPKKKMKQIQADEVAGKEYVVQSAGHAYVGKELATNHSLSSGVDVFNPSSNPRPVAVVPPTKPSILSSSTTDADESKKRKREEKKMMKAQKKKLKKIEK
jgi:RNA-binding motif X-linked protein 2